MACFYPLKGYRAKYPNPSGKFSIVFNAKDGYADMPITVPCGRCTGCRLEKSRQWATRCVHEAQMHDENSYLTLTFSDQHLPDDYSVRVRDHQLFLKKLRKHVYEKTGRKLRFFLCGEYGDLNRRPHYHALIFGYQFKDLRLWKKNPNGDPVYTSETLTRIWGMGHCTVGEVTFQSAAYVARYVMKKQTGENAEMHYTTIHPLTGEIVCQNPEYVTMSRGGNKKGRGGIGARWLEQFQADAYPSDFIIMNGVKVKPPKWYDTVLEADDPLLYREIKRRRKAFARKSKDNTPARLKVREKVAQAKLEKLERKL